VSEPAIKRRLRVRKRVITTTLEAQGYKVRTFETGPFHLFACRGKTALAIRVSFETGRAHDAEVNMVRLEPVPERCLREVWTISDKGRIVTIARIA
jgi:hypothetical protein